MKHHSGTALEPVEQVQCIAYVGQCSMFHALRGWNSGTRYSSASLTMVRGIGCCPLCATWAIAARLTPYTARVTQQCCGLASGEHLACAGARQ